MLRNPFLLFTLPLTLMSPAFTPAFGLEVVSKTLCDDSIKGPVLFTIGGGSSPSNSGDSDPKWTLGQKTTREFSSGDLEVHLATPVMGRSVSVRIPAQMNSKELLEALATVRTAKTLGAREVFLLSETPLSKIKIEGAQLGILLESLMAVAGAERINGQPIRYPVPPVKPLLAETTPKAEASIMSASYPELAASIAKQAGLPLLDRSANLPEKSTVYLVANLGSKSHLHIVDSLRLIAELKAKGNTVTLISPYLPYARSDKLDHPGESTVGGRLIADLFETVGTDGILFVRAHAPQTQGFYRFYSENIKGAKTLFPVLRELNINQILSPDEGAAKENGKFARELGVSTNMLNKVRDPETGKTKIAGIQDSNVEGLRVVCLDDELDTGGTCGNGADLLKSKGATYYAVVATHLTGNALRALDNPNVDLVIVTDSVPVGFTHPKLKVVSLAGELASRISELESAR
jgi:ribose-phosphate pyrophosphokinase